VTEDHPARPVLRVVHGDPTPEELAALVAVLGARAAASGGTGPAATRSAWNDPRALVRRPLAPGSDGWRRSALPR
jgi:hypothetical protein